MPPLASTTTRAIPEIRAPGRWDIGQVLALVLFALAIAWGYATVEYWSSARYTVLAFALAAVGVLLLLLAAALLRGVEPSSVVSVLHHALTERSATRGGLLVLRVVHDFVGRLAAAPPTLRYRSRCA